MKKLLLILCLGCTVNLTSAQEQNPQHSIQDKHHKVVAYINGGTVADAQNAIIGEFKSGDGKYTVSDKNHKILGYVLHGNEVQDILHKTLGYIKEGGAGAYSVTVVNADQKILGYINSENGAVTDNMHNLLGYENNTELSWAAPYFFFFKFQ